MFSWFFYGGARGIGGVFQFSTRAFSGLQVLDYGAGQADVRITSARRGASRYCGQDYHGSGLFYSGSYYSHGVAAARRLAVYLGASALARAVLGRYLVDFYGSGFPQGSYVLGQTSQYYSYSSIVS